MNNWLIFLQSQGATIAGGQVATFGETPVDYPGLGDQTLLIPLIDTGLITITGEAGRQFLQGQVTCDLDQLTENNSLPGAQCNPKGRMLSSFQLLQQDNDSLLMTLAADLIDSTLSSLKKYAVFFKATLEDASDNYVALGLVGPNAEAALKTVIGATPSTTQSITRHNDGFAIRLANQCFQLLVPADKAQDVWQQIKETATPAGLPLWQRQMIRAGLGQVVAATEEMFIPQMLNLQATNAISFSKGCYTGQEVVARMKYLGKLKRRMYRLLLNTGEPPPAGAVCHLTEGGQGVGNVVNAIAVSPETVEALVVLTAEAAEVRQLIIDGTTITTESMALPYSLEDS